MVTAPPALGPTVESVVLGLLPWLSPVTRSRSLSRSNAVRRHRSPSMSPYWNSRPLFYSFLQEHFPEFKSDVKLRPRIVCPSSFDGPSPGTYYICQAGIRCYRLGVWHVEHTFDSLDLLISFPLRSEVLYFTLLPPL